MMWLRCFSVYSRLEAHAEELRKGNEDLTAAITELTGQLSDLNNRCEGVIHQLEIERARRIAAETVASERGGQVTWLREELAKSQERGESARAEQLQSLNLVNTALLKPLTPEPVPDMSQWKVVSKQKVQATTMRQRDDQVFADAMRKGKLGDYVKGLYQVGPQAPPVEETA